MQGWRQPQPSGTNRPSSYPSHPRGRSCMCLAGATQVDQDTGSGELAVRPPGHAEGTLMRGRHSHRHKTSAAHRSAAMAGGARPDPFRTRKLSRRAPMVLRGQPVGEQGAADRWTALDPHLAGSGAGAPRGIPPAAPPFSFSPYRSAEGPAGPFLHGRHPALSADRRGRAVRPPGPAALLLCGRSTWPARRRSFRDPAPFFGYRALVPSVGPSGVFSRARGRDMRLYGLKARPAGFRAAVANLA